MLYLLIKAIISAVVIVVASELAKRSPGLGALIASLPLVSVFGMIWLWRDTHSSARLSAHRVLAFRVENQPPAMEEMSPYRRVHAPHVQGYFLTGETRFELMSIGSNRTLLRVSSEHKLRIDPVPYWEPIARLAIRQNVGRVLEDIKEKSERNSVGATLSLSTNR